MHVHHSGNDEHTGGSSHTSKGLKIAFLLNLGFLVVEIVGGVLTNSVAILSDAVHDLGDTVTIFVSWLLERFSTKKRTVNHTYGFRRLSVLGALISAVVLILGSAFILYEAIPRLLAPEEVSPRGMLVLALVGTIVSGIAVLRLRGGRKISTYPSIRRTRAAGPKVNRVLRNGSGHFEPNPRKAPSFSVYTRTKNPPRTLTIPRSCSEFLAAALVT